MVVVMKAVVFVVTVKGAGLVTVRTTAATICRAPAVWPGVARRFTASGLWDPHTNPLRQVNIILIFQ